MIEAKKDGGTVDDVKKILADGWEIVAVDDKQCTGICKVCSVPICIDDVFGMTLDGAKLCEVCMPKPGEVEGQPTVEVATEPEEPEKVAEALSEDVVDLCDTCGRFGVRCHIDLPRPMKRCDVYEPYEEVEET